MSAWMYVCMDVHHELQSSVRNTGQRSKPAPPGAPPDPEVEKTQEDGKAQRSVKQAQPHVAVRALAKEEHVQGKVVHLHALVRGPVGRRGELARGLQQRRQEVHHRAKTA